MHRIQDGPRHILTIVMMKNEYSMESRVNPIMNIRKNIVSHILCVHSLKITIMLQLFHFLIEVTIHPWFS